MKGENRKTSIKERKVFSSREITKISWFLHEFSRERNPRFFQGFPGAQQPWFTIFFESEKYVSYPRGRLIRFPSILEWKQFSM